MRSLASATPLPSLPVALQHVRDLEYFEGPLLSEFRGPGNTVYLYHWCDRDEQANRWLVISIPRHELAAYLARQRPLRSLIQKEGGFLFVVDVDGALQDSGVWLIQSSDLPEEYLPSPESYYSEEAPAPAEVEEVYIADSSILSDPSHFPRKYRDVYSFLAWFGLGASAREIGSTLGTYNFTEGYVFRTAFEQLSQSLDPAKQTHLLAISAASPGYMSFKVDPGIAGRVRSSLNAYFEHRSAIRESYSELALLAEDSPRVEGSLELLGVDYQQLISALDLPRTGKLLRAFINRLEDIHRQHARGHLRLIGLDWQAGVAPWRGDALL